jgi:Methyltransferase domain
MANEFPHCEVLGIDLAPVPIRQEGVPPNCRFEMDDINRGLSHLHGQFDVVFARAIGMGLNNFRRSLADIEACAKPGGILIWIDGDFDVYSGYPIVYQPFWSESNPNGSYTRRVIYGESRIGHVKE